ncbi:MAG: 6-aminohexanoate-dimer hydrolase [Paracoccaceae bacterium]|nr:MAG: 6-aminohexanoate-dimer hydrolase [Paracoccaceae bacterium]
MTPNSRDNAPTPPIMAGFPVPPEWRVPLDQLDAAPWNRWSFQHMRELVPTVEVRRGADVWDLPGGGGDVDAIPCTDARGAPSSWGAMLDATHADAALVWLDGRVIAECYRNGMDARRPHLAMSVTKSVVGAVAGCLIGEGLLDPAAPVTGLAPELRRTAWAGATLQQVLDMTTGVRFDESYGRPGADIMLIDVAAGWKPPFPWMDPASVPGCVWDVVLGLRERDAPHGARFAYRSIETDVLGVLMERAAGMRLADLVSARLWAPMGAAEDGYFTVDRAGFALADGGFNACLRDYARFGRLLAEDGARDGRQVIPKAWIADIRAGAHGLFDDAHRGIFPEGRYRNQFWVIDRRHRAHLSLGIHGQHLLVDPDRGLVAVKLSSWPDPLGDNGAHLAHWLNAVEALARAHGAPAAGWWPG